MTQYSTRNTHYVIIIAFLLIAAAFRFYALADLPLGLDQDEIINAIAIRGIMAGERPIFITAGWGREPLYAYAAAAVVSLVGDMVLGMRLTTVMFSMVFLAVAYVTARQLFNRAIALMTLGWLVGGFWPLMTSRAGERNILLALFATFTVYLFHRALSGGRWNWARAGVALGVTLWTYQSSRVMPFVFVAFAVYLAVTQRAVLRTNWKGIVVFLLVGLLVASPLLAYLATHPGAETGDFKTQSLQALQQGDWRPMISAALGTLGLFTVRGEVYWLHNIPGRPILDWLGGILFYVGLVAAILRWRRAEYALILLWLAVGLAPAMITDPPSHHRMANVMAAAYMLPALGADWIAHKLDASRFTFHPSRFTLYAWVVMALLAWTATTTAHDFFGVWAVSPEVQDLRFAPLAQLSRDLDRDPDTSPVVVAGAYIEDIEPLVPVALMKRRDISFRWYAAGSAQVIPGQVSRARYFDSVLGLRSMDADALRHALLARASAVPDVWLAPPGDALPETVGTPAVRPISFDGRVEFLGAQIEPPRVSTFWRVLRDGLPSSTAMFAHLTAPDMKIIAQDDRLGFPTHSWRAGDVFAQTFTLNVPAALPGRAWLEIGIYDRATGKRWEVTSEPGVNRVLMQWSVAGGQ
jgi:4-amino-4-deoxy-L-arabinose transferase-like glycosyltransferase